VLAVPEIDQRDNSTVLQAPAVTVRGLGVAPAQPDGVKVVLTVRHRSDAADQALGEASGKAQALERLFQELSIDRDRWVTVGLGLNEWTEWDEQGRRELRRGYEASSRVAVTLPNADDLGRLLAEAAGRVEAGVDGPWWDVAPENPAHEEARRRAMADARLRASVYADAAGLTLGELVEVVEVEAQRPRATTLARATFSSLAGSEMPAHSEGLQVTAGVDVTSLMSPAS